MVRQVVQLYDRLVAPTRPVTGDAAALLGLAPEPDLPSFVRLITALRERDVGDETPFDRRWTAGELREMLALQVRYAAVAARRTYVSRPAWCGAPEVSDLR
jgi:hypothetical protein